jgi:hypothetical protein
VRHIAARLRDLRTMERRVALVLREVATGGEYGFAP